VFTQWGKTDKTVHQNFDQMGRHTQRWENIGSSSSFRFWFESSSSSTLETFSIYF